MTLKAAFLAHAPDAEPEKNKCVVGTSKYKLFVAVVKNQDQAIKECKRLVKEEGINAVMLCPGFTTQNVAELSEVLEGKAGVFVARGDGPSTRAWIELMAKDGWFSESAHR
jgi:hypothetical protein